MSKLILLVAVFAFAWWLVRRYLRFISHKAGNAAPPSEDMVRCVQCGVHLPRSESHSAGGKLYCCEEHGRLNG